MVNSACMLRRDCFESLGGFNVEIPLYEDVDFWMRAIRRHGFVFVDRPILEYRTGAPSLIHDLNGDWDAIGGSYRIIHDRYRESHGTMEYAALKLLSFALPHVSPGRSSAR